MVFLKDFFEKVNFEKSQMTKKIRKTFPACKELNTILFELWTLIEIFCFYRYALIGMDMALADYDGRTALHLAAAEGHENIVRFLLEKCDVSPHLKDR